MTPDEPSYCGPTFTADFSAPGGCLMGDDIGPGDAVFFIDGRLCHEDCDPPDSTK